MRILITGGAKRIGASLVEHFALLGYQVVLHYNHSEKEAKELLTKIGGAGKNHQLIKADLSKESQVKELFAKAQELAPIDILINNASTYHRSNLLDVSSEQLLLDYQVNFFAPFTLMQEFAKQKVKGVIINMLDQRIKKVEPSAGSYAFAKKSLRDATLACALEWAPDIRVCGIALGSVLPPVNNPTYNFNQEVAKTPMKKAVSLEEVAQCCQMIIKSATLTGAIIHLDGGWHLG